MTTTTKTTKTTKAPAVRELKDLRTSDRGQARNRNHCCRCHR